MRLSAVLRYYGKSQIVKDGRGVMPVSLESTPVVAVTDKTSRNGLIIASSRGTYKLAISYTGSILTGVQTVALIYDLSELVLGAGPWYRVLLDGGVTRPRANALQMLLRVISILQ